MANTVTTFTPNNAWNAAAVAIAGVSPSIAVPASAGTMLVGWGTVTTATTITLQTSIDGSTWVDQPSVVVPANSTFTLQAPWSATYQFMRLKSSAASTISATLATYLAA